jgi:hypothetical protein
MSNTGMKMQEKNRDRKTEFENVLGPGYEPLAVCLMIIFIWMFFLSVGATIFI